MMSPKTANSFKVKFRGTRGSYPTPKTNFLKYGANTACVEVRCGRQLIILDAGTGIIDVGLDEVRTSIVENNFLDNSKNDFFEKISKNTRKDTIFTTILLSHIHQDHIQGLQFYKPLFMENSKVSLFGPQSNVIDKKDLKETLKTVLFDKVFPLALDEVRSDFNIENFSQNDVLILSQDGTIKKYPKNLLENNPSKIKKKKDDIIITAYKTTAHPKDGCLCIKIEYNSKTLVYATDKESYVGMDKNFIRFAYHADCLIHDAQYTHLDYVDPINPKQGFGHSTFEMALDTAHLSKVKRLFFFHYDPAYDDNKLSTLEREFSGKREDTEIEFAKENYELEL